MVFVCNNIKNYHLKFVSSDENYGLNWEPRTVKSAIKPINTPILSFIIVIYS